MELFGRYFQVRSPYYQIAECDQKTPSLDLSGLRKNKKGKALRLIKANIIINLPKSVSNDPIIQNVLNNPLGKYGGD